MTPPDLLARAWAALTVLAASLLLAFGPAAARATEPGSVESTVTCRVEGWSVAAEANAVSLPSLEWAPFGRPEIGWAVYAPLIQREIETACDPGSTGFASRLAAWQAAHTLNPTGVMTESDFLILKAGLQDLRDFIRVTAQGVCPETADVIAAARAEEGYGGKTVWARPAVLAAYRRLVAAARAQSPQIAEDARNLTIFSGYRSPTLDGLRCAAEGNCNGIVRARCSAHRTGLALDLYVGQAEGYGPDASADPSRLFLTRTATYRWLLANAGRFGFVNYPFEPWHWEWTGEAP